jgi:hypothetical protein
MKYLDGVADCRKVMQPAEPARIARVDFLTHITVMQAAAAVA